MTLGRREVLNALGATGGVSALAGCAWIGGDDGERVSDAQFQVFDPEETWPADRNLNPWHLDQSGCRNPGSLVFDDLAVYSTVTRETYPLIAEDWELTDDTTLAVTLSDEWTWTNGDTFVAQDWVTQAEIELAVESVSADEDERPHPVMESAEAVDETRLEISLHEPFAETYAVRHTIARPELLTRTGTGVFAKHDADPWRDWHNQLQSADAGEREDIVEDLIEADTPSISAFADGDAHSTGPFRIAEVSDGEIVTERRPEHPHAETVAFERLTLRRFDETEGAVAALARGDVDASQTGFPPAPDREADLPAGTEYFREGMSTNRLIMFNCGHDIEADRNPPTADRRVRQAVCHLYRRSATRSRLDGPERVFEYPPCRVPHTVLEHGDGVPVDTVESDLTDYADDTGEERAAALLEAAGYAEEDGEWVDSETGERLELKILDGPEREDVAALVASLESFGIAVNWLAHPEAIDQRRAAGDYDIMPDSSSAYGIEYMWTSSLVADWIQRISHFDPNPELPMPVGDPSGAGGTKEISVREHIADWNRTGDEEYYRELLWWWNQFVPQMETMWVPDAGAIDTERWALDAPFSVAHGTHWPLYTALALPETTVRQTDN